MPPMLIMAHHPFPFQALVVVPLTMVTAGRILPFSLELLEVQVELVPRPPLEMASLNTYAPLLPPHSPRVARHQLALLEDGLASQDPRIPPSFPLTLLEADVDP